MTPRTDAKERETRELAAPTHAHYGWKHARALERELAAANEANAALRAEVERLRQDAERYRWLRENARATSEHWGGRWSLVIEGPAPGGNAPPVSIDAAIDAARKPEPRMWYSKKDDPTNWNTDPYDTSTGMKIARPTRKE